MICTVSGLYNVLWVLGLWREGPAGGDRWDGRSESPPWEIEGEHGGSPFINRDETGTHLEGCETGPPPPSQTAVADSGITDPTPRSPELEPVENVDGKGTPSTLSDDVDDGGADTAGATPRRARGGNVAKKRLGSKGVESEGHDTSEEGQDARRRPRKSARLA